MPKRATNYAVTTQNPTRTDTNSEPLRWLLAAQRATHFGRTGDTDGR